MRMSANVSTGLPSMWVMRSPGFKPMLSAPGSVASMAAVVPAGIDLATAPTTGASDCTPIMNATMNRPTASRTLATTPAETTTMRLPIVQTL